MKIRPALLIALISLLSLPIAAQAQDPQDVLLQRIAELTELDVGNAETRTGETKAEFLRLLTALNAAMLAAPDAPEVAQWFGEGVFNPKSGLTMTAREAVAIRLSDPLEFEDLLQIEKAALLQFYPLRLLAIETTEPSANCIGQRAVQMLSKPILSAEDGAFFYAIDPAAYTMLYVDGTYQHLKEQIRRGAFQLDLQAGLPAPIQDRLIRGEYIAKLIFTGAQDKIDLGTFRNETFDQLLGGQFDMALLQSVVGSISDEMLAMAEDANDFAAAIKQGLAQDPAKAIQALCAL